TNSIRGWSLFNFFRAVLGFSPPPMSVVFLFGVLWKRTTTRAANFALSFGTVLSLGTGIFYLWIFPKEQYDFWPHFLLLSFIIFVVLAVLTWLVVVLDKNAPTRENALTFDHLPRPDRIVRIMWTALIAVMIGLYVFFNGH
ncbi:MAG TPA: hypothetical protein PKE06_23405, partial [Flavilitoribacter sp.]|nr:hypothetical protein [Flavilitoribacter sp.]